MTALFPSPSGWTRGTGLYSCEDNKHHTRVFFGLFVHSSNKYLWHTYVPSTALTKAHTVLALYRTRSLVREVGIVK